VGSVRPTGVTLRRSEAPEPCKPDSPYLQGERAGHTPTLSSLVLAMGLAITSNPCPTEHGAMGFPTVTHSFAYLGTRQPARWHPRGWQTLPVRPCKRRFRSLQDSHWQGSV